MNDRLSPHDVTLLDLDGPSTPMHVGTLAVIEQGEKALDYDRLVSLVQDRLAFVPRYRQRVRHVPGRIAAPLWVDDEDFDISYHVRLSALPRPGTMDQLREFVARIISRRLDRNRPLWEMYLVEGLENGRVALLSKTHQAMVDGVTTLDIAQVILDAHPDVARLPGDSWEPVAEPSGLRLMAGAVAHPRDVASGMRAGAGMVGEAITRFAGATSHLAGRFARTSTPESPLRVRLSEQRRFVPVETELQWYRRVRDTHGGTVNDVILATVSGALRAWLMTRGENMTTTSRVRAVVPMSLVPDDGVPTSVGSRVSAYIVDLPVGETNPVIRLHQISYQLQAHRETGRAVAARRLAQIGGFGPATFHALGSRVATSLPRRSFQLVVTNVPGPQVPLYAGAAQMVASYPMLPLVDGQAMSLGVTSYQGTVCFGLVGDRDGMGDLDVMGQCLSDALEELVDTTTDIRPRAPRGRARPVQATRSVADASDGEK